MKKTSKKFDKEPVFKLWIGPFFNLIFHRSDKLDVSYIVYNLKHLFLVFKNNNLILVDFVI